MIGRLERLLADGVLSRFGPLYDAEKMGGGLTLAAMAVPAARFEEVAEAVNAFPEVAHNYEREPPAQHVVRGRDRAPRPDRKVLAEIEAATGLQVLNMPKLEEFFLELRLTV